MQAETRRWRRARLFLAESKAAETLVEAIDPAARIDQIAAAAGPCRVRFRVDIEIERVALGAPGRAGLEFRAVGHLDGDEVIIGMGIGFHEFCFLIGWFPTSRQAKARV